MLRRYGVTVEYYGALIGKQIEELIRPNTRLIWCESPGFLTMDVQDVPAIVKAAHRHEIPVALDNTVVGGHSDLLLGSC